MIRSIVTVLTALVCIGRSVYGRAPLEAECFGDDRFDNVKVGGRKALVVTTSHGVLGEDGCESCKKSGVLGEEFTAPFLKFYQAGMDVTLASIKGGEIPVDPQTFMILVESQFDREFFSNKTFTQLLKNSPSVGSLDFTQFDIIYMAGGWGAAWDLATSDDLANGITAAYARDKVLGSVCHGSLGFVRARKPDGSNLCAGKHMTGVTNRQVRELGINFTPYHPEEELKKAGAIFECKHGLIEPTQNYIAQDGNIITGQNQLASCQVPQLMLLKLHEKIHNVGELSPSNELMI